MHTGFAFTVKETWCCCILESSIMSLFRPDFALQACILCHKIVSEGRSLDFVSYYSVFDSCQLIKCSKSLLWMSIQLKIIKCTSEWNRHVGLWCANSKHFWGCVWTAAAGSCFYHTFDHFLYVPVPKTFLHYPRAI